MTIEQEEAVRDAMRRLADESATKAVADVMMMLGVDVRDPIKAQEQFSVLRQLASSRTMDNLKWLESLHTAAERVTETSWKTTTKVIVTATLAAFALLFKEYWANHIPTFWK